MKTVIAKFTGDNYANVYDVYQWDYGQVLRIEGLKLPNMVEIHFSLQETSGEAKTRIGVTKDGVTDVVIPDSFLENEGIGDNYKIFVWVYVADKESGSTEYKITIHVKARAKPEITHGRQDGEVFQEAVEAVQDAAKRAAESEKQAERWAVGRVDVPGSETDNSKFYAEESKKNAQQTTKDKEAVEELVKKTENIGQLAEEVKVNAQKASESAKNAETSAVNASVSEKNAKTSESNASTSETNAKASETNAKASEQAVEESKQAVDKAVTDFRQAVTNASAALKSEKDAHVKAITTAGTTETRKVTDEGTKQVQAVQSTGTQEVEKVTAEGTKQVGLIKTEGEKHLVAVQTATQEIIADREQIQKNKTDIAELRQKKADAIVETASGTLLNVKDSADALFEDFSVYGKSEQAQTTGKNILSIPNIDINTPETIIKCNISKDICISVQEKATVSKSVWRFMALYKNNDKQYITDASLPGVFYATSENPIVSITCRGIMITSGAYTGIMVEYGTTATAYEPYTGGKPSPSPEYPQEPVNAGRLNLDTKKCEIEIKVTGKNIFNVEKLNEKWNVGVNYYYIPLFVGKGSRVSFSVSKKLTTGLKVYALFSKEFGGNEKAYSWIYHSSEEGLIKAKGTFVAETDVILLSFAGDKAILINELFNYLQVEISETPTSYEPYKEQTLTLTSDRRLTKWDRLVKQDGQIGWLYATKYIEDLAEIIRDNTPIYGTEQKYFNVLFENEKFNYSMEKVVSETGHYKVNKELYTIDVKENTFLIKINADDTIQTAKEHLHYSVMYNTTQTEFVPLPQSEQEAIRALQTYYPTTVVSNNENMEMELSYVADTKNYTDRKIEEAVSVQIQNLANLLSLMPLSTQAAMIENDTNNILDMEVQR